MGNTVRSTTSIPNKIKPNNSIRFLFIMELYEIKLGHFPFKMKWRLLDGSNISGSGSFNAIKYLVSAESFLEIESKLMDLSPARFNQ
jgi:hypothetical protein